MDKFRDLKADEIDVRIGTIKENKGLQLLLYKDARVDMNILDETVGAENWQREHYECKGNLFCKVGINTQNGWIFKSDCGSESNTEAEKGEASDSFKRACVNWGIGRELYTAPYIWVSNNLCNITAKTKGTGYVCNDKFIVKEIKIENKQITGLKIYNQKTKQFVFDNISKSADTNFQTNSTPIVAEVCEVCGKALTKKLADQCKAKYNCVVCSAECLQKRTNK